MSTIDLDSEPQPVGKLAVRTVAMPANANASGDIFGGWLVSQMDIAGAAEAYRIACGRVATVAIESMVFLGPVRIGSTVSLYTKVLKIGRSSIQILVDVWSSHPTEAELHKVTEGIFTFVAIDENRRTRPVPRD